MTSAEHSAVQQQDPVQGQIYEAAERLRVLLGMDTSTEMVIGAVEDLKRVEENKKVLLRFQHEVFNQGDWSTETLQRNLTDDFIDHAAMQGDPPGLEGVQMRFSAWASAFAEAEEENELMLGEKDLLAVMYTLHAHHRGEFMGVPPTDRDVAIPGMEVVRIRDGKIAEHWGIYDFLRTAEEIGANLAFLPRDAAQQQPQLQVPWAVKMTEQDAPGLGAAAEDYLRPRDEN
ncbi:MAG TPA: ester cyclase [Rugosimonospora sp.]|nr:ester cyclase [Rugosimonospora sp.]